MRLKDRKLNVYIEKPNFMVGICSDGTEFIFDKSDYSSIKEYTWRRQSNHIYTNINRKCVALSHFLIRENPQRRILFKEKGKFDYRRENLFTGNTYIEENDYYKVLCYNDKCFYISKCDYDIAKKYIWHIDKGGYVISKDENGIVIKYHRLIMGIHNETSSIEVDHINRLKNDNRRENLRLVNRSLNCFNQKISKYNKSGTVGVHYSKSSKQWIASITCNKKRYYLGTFKNKQDAIKKRKSYEIKLYGENLK